MRRLSPSSAFGKWQPARLSRLEHLEPRWVLSVYMADAVEPATNPPSEPDAFLAAETASVIEPLTVNLPVTSDPDVQQMPSIAVNPLNPDHLVIAYMDYSLVDTGYAGIGVSTSDDAGQTWQASSIPLPEDFDQGAAQPIAKFDDQGRPYVSFMAVTFKGDKAHLTSPDWFARWPGFEANSGVFVARSDTGGLTWNDPVAIASQMYEGQDISFELMPDLAIDTFAHLPNGKPNPNWGNLYVAWSRAYTTGFPGHPDSAGGIDIMLAVSEDGGQTWETQLQEMWNDDNGDGFRQEDEVFLASVIQDPENAPTGWPGVGIVDQARLTVGPEGNVYVSHWGGGDFVIHLSTDGGENFTSPDHTTGEWIALGTGYSTGIDYTLPNNHFRMFVMRAIVADPSRPGHVYAVDPVRVLDAVGNQVDPADIYFARSTDSGRTWQTAFTVGEHETSVLNDDNHGQIATGVPNDVIASQALARSAVDAQGNIAVIWYDARRDPADHLLDVWATVSADGGQTFSPNFRVTDVSFDADQGVFTNAVGEDEYYLGEFLGLAMANGKAYAAWTDTRGGNQDIFVRYFAVDSPPDPPNDRFEPNDTSELTGSPTMLGRVAQRVLPKLAAAPGDEDWFLVEAIATGELIASALFSEEPSSTDAMRVELWNRDATTFLSVDDVLLDDSGNAIGREARFAATAGDELLVRVVGPDVGPGAQTVDYSLRLQSLTADLGARAYAHVDETLEPGGALLYLVRAAAAGSIDVRLTGGADVEGDLNLQVLDPGDFSVLATGQPVPIAATSQEDNDSIPDSSDTGLVQPGAVSIDSTIGDGQHGTTTGDYDFFGFWAGAGQRISVEVNVFVVDSALDSMILLYDSDGEFLEVVDSASSGGNEFLSYVTDVAGNYYVAVAAWQSWLPEDPFIAGTGQGADPDNTGNFRITIRTETIGPGATEGTSLPIRPGEPVLLLVTGDDESSGDCTLEFTNFDQFTTPENDNLLFPAGSGPSSAAVGHLNSDGNLDLVVANALSNTVSVLLGNGDGTFQAPRQFAIGAFITPAVEITGFIPIFGRRVAIADFNSDSIPDIVATNYASSDVSVLLGRGDGTFEPQRRFDATWGPIDLDVGDVNGDKLPDVTAITPSADGVFTVATLLGRGDGTFEPQQTVQVPSGGSNNAGSVRVADLNHDDKPDLVVAGHNISQISILLGNGDGTFAHFGDFDAVRLSTDLSVVDIDGDGNLDIANIIFDGNRVSVLMGIGDGSFQSYREFSTGWAPAAIEVADVGSRQLEPGGSTSLGPPDGWPDLIVAYDAVAPGRADVGTPGIAVLPGVFDDHGQFVEFGPSVRIADAEAPIDVDVADVNNDGALDVISVDRDGILVVFGHPPNIVPNDAPDTARDLGAVVHLVQPTQTIVPGHENAFYTVTVPTEVLAGWGDEVIDFSALFEATGGAGLQMEVFDATGSLRGSGERCRVRAEQGEELLLHVFGAEGSDGTSGSGAYTLVVDVLPQVVSVEAQSFLPGVDARPGGSTTSLVITFQGDRLDLATAEDPSHYTVTFLGADAAPGTADDRLIPIGGAGVEQPIVYNPGANIEVSTGQTYPTAVRQTVTLLFAEPLPAGSYEIELSSAIQAALFSEAEPQQLADPDSFAGHPVVSFDTGQITEGARVDAVDLVLQTGPLGDLGEFEVGTAFLTQLQDDLGALLDAILSEIGDDPSITDSILDQILDRLGPSLGEFGQRPTEILVIFLDPVSFSLADPGGSRAVFNLQTNTLVSNIPNTSVEVWGNVELVIVPIPFGNAGTYELDIADVPPRARGGAIFLGNEQNDVYAITPDIRSGIDHFTFTVGSISLLQLMQTYGPTDTPPSIGPELNRLSSNGADVRSPANPPPASESGAYVDHCLGSEPCAPLAEFSAVAGDDGRATLEEFKAWSRLRTKEADFVGDLFTQADKNRDAFLDYDEFLIAYEELTDQRTADGNEPPVKNVDGKSQDAEILDDPSDDIQEAPVSRIQAAWGGKTWQSLSAKALLAFDAVYAGDFAELWPAPSHQVVALALTPDDIRITQAGADALLPLPKGILENLSELFDCIWDLLARCLGG